MAEAPRLLAAERHALAYRDVVSWRYRADPLAALREVGSRGYTPVALETSSRALPVDELQWPASTCLVIGNEVSGVSPAVQDECGLHVKIPMLGVKDTLNVAVAFGTTAHAAARSLSRR